MSEPNYRCPKCGTLRRWLLATALWLLSAFLLGLGLGQLR